MEGFTYSNIFDTKGIEYLAILAFFAILIPFWLLLNKQGKVKRQFTKVLGIMTTNILKIPQGLFYNKNHTWAHLERSGAATVGVDDLLTHITGELKFNNLRKTGEILQKGDLLTEFGQNGKTLRIFSPISGKILETNPLIMENPEMVINDPCGNGWIYKIKPTNWKAEAHSCYLAEEATNWSKRELERFKEFMVESVNKYSSGTALTVLQDGGELREHVLSELPTEIWNDFQKEFLNP